MENKRNILQIRDKIEMMSKNYQIEAAVILDCIGHDLPIKGMEDVIFAVGTESSKKLSRIVDGLTDRHDLAMIAVHNDYVGDLPQKRLVQPYLDAIPDGAPHDPAPGARSVDGHRASQRRAARRVGWAR